VQVLALARATRSARLEKGAASGGPVQVLALARATRSARLVSRETISESVTPSAAPLGPRATPLRGSPAKTFLSRELQHLAKAIESRLGKDLGILRNGSGGELTIPFESQDQLRAFLSSLLRSSH
jgi:hypothetical protein